MKITTGFLTGNLLANAPCADEDATARRFARSLQSAITRRYPEAEVAVGWRTGSGFLPQELWTAVDHDPGHGEVDAVNSIVGEVIRGGDYLVLGSAASAEARARREPPSARLPSPVRSKAAPRSPASPARKGERRRRSGGGCGRE